MSSTSAQGDDTSARGDFGHRHAFFEHFDGGGERPGLSKNISQVGFLDLGLFQISDIWAHGDYAYLGGFGGTAVKIVDISDPSSPTLAAELAGPDPFCSLQDVKVEKINTKYFKGDLLAVGGDGCFTGLQLWDVSDPTDPELLSANESPGGSVDPEFIHNVYIFEQGNRAYVAAISGFNELFTPFGDLLIVDVTDPTSPAIVGDWGAGKDGGLAFGTPGVPIPPFPPGSDCTPPDGTPELCRGDLPFVNGHDVWVNTQGTIAYVSYWDAGVILLDISDPSNPTLISRAGEPVTFGSNEGNAHVAVPARGGNLMIVGDEDFTAGPWGFLRIFDTSDLGNPVEIGAYATENALTNPNPLAASFSAHNLVVQGNRAFVSWYDDGIRVIDFSQPSAPREIAAFVPERLSSFWGVYVHQNLILGSDLGGGLYILQLK